MSIKDLFDRNYLSTKTEKDAYSSIESARNLKAVKTKQDSFLPQVDYADPQSFARYGSAQLYYKSAIERIVDFYPFDGSAAEINGFYNKSLDIEKYIFNSRYPRTTGYVILSAEGYGSPTVSADGYSLYISESSEYITFFGGPNVVNETEKLSELTPDDYSSQYQYNNVYEDNIYSNAGLPSDYGSGTRQSNLRSNFDTGVTVEFWGKTGSVGWDPSQTSKQVVFDMWNSELSSSDAYGRLTIELTGGAGAGNPLLITVQSGTLSASAWSIVTSSIGQNLDFQSWRHYAVQMENSGSDFIARLYVDGELNATNTYSAINIGELQPKNMRGRLGGLLTAPSGSTDVSRITQYNGAGRFSGSLDEFRFWKVSRNAEDIGRYWFDQVRGGTNTDIANTTLGMYYKFNEGISQNATIDSTVLDYGGRLCNGIWTGYTTSSRNTGSAIVSASASESEYLDPIIYGTHPSVLALKTELANLGKFHDTQNAGQFINLVPSWVVEEVEQDDGESNLQQLAHIMGAYFDKLYLQISALPSFRHAQYTSASSEPIPFAQHLPQSLGLFTPEIFVDSKVLEKFANRTDTEIFEKDLNETKNLIYQNLYNNLTTIFKSKGTHRAVRNVLKCFNIDDNLVYFNIYSNNNTYELNNNLKQVQKRKKYINFNQNAGLEAVMFQAEDPAYPTSVSYISGSGEPKLPGVFPDGVAGDQDKYGMTLEANIFFPRFVKSVDPVNRNFITASLFGMQTAFTASTGTGFAGGTTALTGAQDVANFQVYAVRDEIASKNVYFKLTSSLDPHPFNALTSSNFYNVYGNENWNLSVALKPSNYPLADVVSGSQDYTYDVIFRGYNNKLGTINNSFEVSASVTRDVGQSMLRSWKRVYAGAQNTNITGSNVHKTDVLLDGVKYWTQYVDEISLKQHALDRENFGISGSYRNISALDTANSGYDVYNFTTLALNWYFGNITGSGPDADNLFYSSDLSSGSAFVRDNFGWPGEIGGYLHPGRGYGFPVSNADVVKTELANEFKFINPEIVVGDDMINILSEDDQVFGLFDEIPSYVYTVEKSNYAAISEEILDYFAGVVDFNSMIGDPVHRYRMDYKPIELLRRIFFERFQDVSTVEKFAEYFRWFDDAIANIIQQVVPASADFIPNMYNTVESHILERAKYHTKFPTLEFGPPSPVAPIRGIEEKILSYMTDLFGGVEASPRPTNRHKNYWKKRAQPGAKGVGSYEISSGDANVDRQRKKIRNISWRNPILSGTQTILSTADGQQYELNNFLRTQLDGVYKLQTPDILHTIKGGVNFVETKNIHYTYNSLYPAGPVNTADGVFVPENVLYSDLDWLARSNSEIFQVLDPASGPREKRKRHVGVVQGREYDGGLNYTNTKNSVAFPFNIMSASISGGVDALISSRASSSITITNLHNDVYGEDMEVPLQGPFTNYAVGGHQSRHVPLNTSGSGKIYNAYNGLDDYTSRPEAWKLLLGKRGACPDPLALSGAIGMVSADYPWPEANDEGARPYPMTASQKAVYYRDFVAKRPVNIRNIRLRTGSTILGNYQENYQIVMTNGAHINPRNLLTEQLFLPGNTFPARASSSTQVRTFLSTRRTDDAHFEWIPEYSVSYLTSAAGNKTVITNRFANPGGVDSAAPGYRDFRGNEYTPYVSPNYRNLSVLRHSQPPSGTFSEPVGAGTPGIRVFDIHGRSVGLVPHYARHTARFGRDSVALKSIPYSLTSSMYIRSPSVYTYNYSSGLQGWWRLNEDLVSAGMAVDSSGNGRNGTASPATRLPTFTTAYFPNKFIQAGSCTFDGASKFSNIGIESTWDQLIGNDTGGTSKMTLAAWIRPHTLGGSSIGQVLNFGQMDVAFYIKSDGASGWELIFYTKWNGGVYARWDATMNGPLNEWAHIAVSYDATDSTTGASPKMYYNGVEVPVSLGAGTTPAGTWDGIDGEDCYIGVDNAGAYYFDGEMADVAVWNTILTAADVQAIHQVGSLLENNSITETTVEAPGSSYNQLPGFHKTHRNNISYQKVVSVSMTASFTDATKFSLSSLQRFYKLNENISTSGDAIDSVGKFDGTCDSTRPSFDTAIAGSSPFTWLPTADQSSDIFDGISSSINIGPASSTSTVTGWDELIGNNVALGSTQKMTFAGWFYKTGDPATLYGKVIDFGQNDLSLYVTSTEAVRFSAKWNGNNRVIWNTPASQYSENEWVHLAVTYDANDSSNIPKIYVNGAESSVVILSGISTGEYYGIRGQAGYLGNIDLDNRLATSGFVGNLSQWGVWNTILPPSDIRELAQAKNRPGLKEIPVYADGEIYDNFNVKHQIPRSTLQYSWITSSMKSTSSFYAPGFTPPSYKVKSSTAVYVDPINFTSQSDVGTYYGNGTKERYLGTSQVKVAAEVNYVNFIPVDYARLNTIIYEPITASTNTLGYGTRMVSGATGPATTITGAAPPMPLAIPAAAGDTPGMAAGYVNFASASTSDRDKVTISRVRTSGDYPTDADNQGTAKILNSILVNRNGPYGWPSWKPMHQQGHPILVNEQQTNKLSTTNQNNALQHWDLPPVSMKGRPGIVNMDFVNEFSTSLGGLKKQHQNVTLQTTYNNEMVGFNQWQLDRFTNLNYDSEVTPFEQLVSLKDRDNIQLNWILYTENIIPSTRREFLSSSTSRVGYENRFWRTLRSDRDRFTFSNSCGVYNYADITGDPDHINYISQSIFCLDAPSQFMTRTGPPVIFSQPQTGFIALGWQLYRGSSLITARYSGSAEGSTNAANPMTASVVSPAGELQNTYSFYHFNTPATSSIIPDVRPEAGSFEKKQIPLCIRNAALYSRKHMLNSPLSLNSPSGLRMIDSTFYGTEANADKTPGNGPHRLRQIPGMEGDATSGSTSASYGPGVTPNAGFGSPSWRGVVGWRVPTGSGEALWEAPSQAGYITSSVVYDPNGPFGPNVPAHRYDFVSKPSAPWYNDYDDFRQTIKTLARGYAVIPEFRISDQVENYVAVNTSQDPNNLSTFSIPGTEFNSAQDSFYKDYSNSDFLKNFLDIKRMSDLDATEIKLTCKAAIKFNPYNGFYPAQRTLQLVSQFSKSFADSVVVSAEFPLTIAQRALWTGSNPQAGPYPPTHVISGSMTYGFSYVRPLVQPFFAPGILYNSIKSGLAVDYPIVESGYNVNRIRVTGSWSDSVNPEFMCENYMLTSNTLTVSGTHKFNLGKASVQAFRNRSYVSGQFWDQRVPFEAIMDPMKYIAGTKIPDIEPHPSVRNPYSFTASMNGPRGPVYKLMASNFFAEVGRFFLKDGDYTKLKSSGVNLAGYKFQEGEVYGARLRIKTSYDGVRSYDYESSSTGNNEFYAFDGAAAYFKSRDGSAGFDYQLSGSAASTSGSFELPQDPALNPTFKKNFIMYSRTTAFGPPVSGRVWGTASGGMLTGSGTDSLIFANNRFALSASCYGVKDSMVGYNWAFTPPYYDGEAWIDFIFRPSASVSYDMETILKETQIIKRRYDPGPDMHGHRRFANDNVAGTGGNYRRTLVSDCAPDLMTGSHWTTGDSRDYPKTFAPYASDNINDNAMQLDSCLNLFGIEQIQKETRDKFGSLKEQTNESIGQRWVIQTKFETPHMNFSDTGAHPITASFPNAVGGMASGSSTLTMPTNFGSSSVPRGMWHQFGVTETSPHRGIFLEMGEIPTTWLKNHYEVVTGSSIYNNHTPVSGNKMYETIKSFSKLMGFEEENSSAKLGEIADGQILREAVVAVPYVIEGLTPGEQQPSGQNAQTRKKFINIPKKRFKAAMSDGSVAGDSLVAAGASIRKMITAMDKYVFPPQFDFMALHEDKRKPIVMYVFEFEYELDKKDLSYIWQNLAPPSYTDTRFEQQSVAHALAGPELLTEYNLLSNPDLRWMVFKVKQRGQSLYPDMVTSQAGEPTMQPAWHLPWAGQYPRKQSFNWPYDYVSIVESIKMDVDVKFDRGTQSSPLRNQNKAKIGKQNQVLSKVQRRKKQFVVKKKK